MVWFGPRGHQRWCILVVSRPFPRFGGGIAEPDKEISPKTRPRVKKRELYTKVTSEPR